jgi:hypothetical protein
MAELAPRGSPDARAARTPTPPASMIQVHLTPYAPGCRDLATSHPKRWATFVGRPPARVIRALLTRLRRAPGDVRVRTDDPPLVVGDWADVDLMAEVDGVAVPVATICRGVTGAQAADILADLAKAGWRPRDILPASQSPKPRDVMPPAATRTDLEQMESYA